MTAVTNTHELAVQYGEVVAMQHHKHGYQPNTDDTHTQAKQLERRYDHEANS